MQVHPTPYLYIVASWSLPVHHWRQALYSDQYLIPACAISCRCPGNTDVTQVECNKSFPLSKRNWVFVQRAVIWDYLHHVWSCSTLVMAVLRGKSSAEQVTLQSSQEKNNDGKTQAASEQCNSREDRERGGVTAGQETGWSSLSFFTGRRGVSSNTCKENESLVLVPRQMTQVQKEDGCTVTISCNITNERTSLNHRALLFLHVPRQFNWTN